MDVREVNSIFMLVNLNIVKEEQSGKSANTTIIRNFYRDRMDIIMDVNGIVAKSVFMRVKND